MIHHENVTPEATPASGGEMLPVESIRLRDYQERDVGRLRAEFMSGASRVLYVLPTGGGKTVVFAHVTGSAAGRGRRVLVIAHRKELIRQASRKLTDAGVEHGIIAPWAPATDHPVQVGSIQTLARRLHRLPRFDLIIIDECHHAVCPQYHAVLESQPQAKLVGVTATPERLDGKGLGREAGGPFDVMVLGPTVEDLVAGGFLTPSRVFAPGQGPDLSGVATAMGDFVSRDLAAAMDRPGITGDSVLHYIRHARGLPAIAFCVTVEHAERVAAAFRDAGFRSTCVHGRTPPDERDAAIAGLATGETQILTSCALISEGLDVPNVGCVILLRPTKSLAMHLQQIGRGLRPALGKAHLIVLDHAGNTLRHGFAEEPRAWSLRGRPKRGGEARTTQCPQCGAVHHPGPTCPECGFSYGGDRNTEVREGDLREITQADRLQRLRRWPLRTLLTGKETREQLEEIRRARGYKPGWVWHTLQSQRTAMLGEGVSQ